MPFRYRLQKVLEFRIREKEKQLLVVQEAQQRVYEAEQAILRNNQEIEVTIQNKRVADFRLMEYYDKYLHHLWDKAEELEAHRQEMQQELEKELQILTLMEQRVKVLEKHKEHQKEEYDYEQKQIEIKQFSEIGVQRHFQRKIEEMIELEQEELKMLENQ